MRKLSFITTLFAMMFVAACGDGSGFVSTGPGPGGSVDVSIVNVLASSPSLPSDAGQVVDITVVVRDQNNVAVSGVTVIMSADSGILTIAAPITDANGIVEATINSGGDPTNRTITIGADANSVVGSVSINVQGTTLSLSGPAALALNDQAPYTIVLSDAAGNGISGQTVDVTSASGNGLASATLTTDISGQAQVMVTASAAGADTLASKSARPCSEKVRTEL